MFNSREILDKIATGESSGVEFKSVTTQNTKIKAPLSKDISDEIAAFANQEGGIIIFGVDDNAHISGIDDLALDSFKQFISTICRDSIKPAIVDLYIDNIKVPDTTGEEKNVVFVKIGKSLWLHESNGGYFYRHGVSKQKMSTDHLIRVGQSRSQARIIRFDEQAIPQTNQDTLQENLYMPFIKDISGDILELLVKRRLLTMEENDYRATVSGVLMCSKKPAEYLFNSFIQAVHYNSKTKDANYQIDAKDFTGPLDEQIIDAFKFVAKYNTVSATKTIGRVEKPQYSLKAIFEAIVNAVVHRDYSKSGSKIRLFMFIDRLEIYSPGALANDLTTENLRHRQITRNELLSHLLSDLTLDDETLPGKQHFLEKRGEGVGIILEESETLSGRKPIYKMLGEELRLIIFPAKSLQDESN